jgi:hypothetical protein
MDDMEVPFLNLLNLKIEKLNLKKITVKVKEEYRY